MGEIKSAHEIAMEKVAKLGEPTEEERRQWKYVPEGEKLAARYLKEDLSLAIELNKYDKSAVKHVKAGLSKILVNNISLPQDERAKKNNRKAMNGIKDLKSDKIAVENVYSKLRNIFSHYQEQGTEQRKQAYQQLKAEFEAQVEQAMQQQLGSFAGVKIDVEKHPQFQDEWRKILAQLDSQYLQYLNEYKQELLDLS